MNIKELLPIGTIVQLQDQKNFLMIFGIKQVNADTDEEFDYCGVLYPEGNIGEAGYVLFNHSEITDIIFRGYEDEAREEFLDELQKFYQK